MKRFFTLFAAALLLIMHYGAHAQTYDTTAYYGKMNYIFQHVDKSQVTTGLLRDYSIDFLNPDNYTGAAIHDSNFVGMGEWRMLYAGLYGAQINGNANLLYLDTINRLVNTYNHTSDPISIIGLYYNYQQLKSTAISGNLMTVTNEQLYDVAGRTQSPYDTKELFALAPIRQVAFKGNNQFIMRSSMFFGNTGKTISTIEVSPKGTATYQLVTLNTPFTVNYDSAGFYNMNFKITYVGGVVKYGHTKITVYNTPTSGGGGARFGYRYTTNESVTATKAYLGTMGQGDITIELGKNNTSGQIKKPLIMVEGFDPDGSFDYYALQNQISYDANTYWNSISLNYGLDDVNNYDMIFLRFKNGTDYIQRNAYLLERVISIVNQRKQANGSTEQNVIIGMSMGGLVARYALRDMEINSVSHGTRLFISHDAPHWGANVPVAAQAAVQHLAPWQIINIEGFFKKISWVDMFPGTQNGLDLFNSPAAKQMVIQRYALSGETLNADNSVHNAFMNEINQMGWPVNCRNVALSNGSCNGAVTFPDNSNIVSIGGKRSMSYLQSLWRALAMSAIAPLNYGGRFINGWNSPQFNYNALGWEFPLALFSTSSSFVIDFNLKAVPRTGTAEIYRGDIYSSRKILGLINVNNYFIKCHAYSNTSMLPLDNAPGGMYDLKQFGFDLQAIQSQLPEFFQNYINTVISQPRFCFVPTVSALAFTNAQNFLFSDICGVVNCQSASGISDHYAPQQNQLHISYTQASTDWLLQAQSLTGNCVKICASDVTINGPKTVCTGGATYSLVTPMTGAVVTWSVSPTNLVSLTANNGSVTLTQTGGSGSVILTANITNACGGVVSKSRKIQVGLANYIPYKINYYNPNGTTLCGGQAYSYQLLTNDGSTLFDDGITGVEWTGNPGSASVNYNSGSYYTNGPTYVDGSAAQLTFHGWAGMSPTPVQVKVSIGNACGWTGDSGDPATYILPQNGNSTLVNCGSGFLMVSPNPVQNTLTINLSDATTTNPTAATKGNARQSAVKEPVKTSVVPDKHIRILDASGKVCKQTRVAGNTSQTQLDVSRLSPGIYFVEISDNTNKETHKIVIQR